MLLLQKSSPNIIVANNGQLSLLEFADFYMLLNMKKRFGYKEVLGDKLQVNIVHVVLLSINFDFL